MLPACFLLLMVVSLLGAQGTYPSQHLFLCYWCSALACVYDKAPPFVRAPPHPRDSYLSSVSLYSLEFPLYRDALRAISLHSMIRGTCARQGDEKNFRSRSILSAGLADPSRAPMYKCKRYGLEISTARAGDIKRLCRIGRQSFLILWMISCRLGIFLFASAWRMHYAAYRLSRGFRHWRRLILRIL